MTALLLGVTGWVFSWQLGLGSYEEAQSIYGFGVVPAHLFGIRIPPPQFDLIAPAGTLLTAQFLHGGWAHAIGNGAVLLLLGPLLEVRIGAIRFLVVYLIAGMVGLGVEAASSPGSSIPIIGASASIAGVIGGLARVDPRARIVLPAPKRGAWLRTVRIPALPVIVTWLIIQVYGLAFGETGAEQTIAFLAHGVGFVAGVLLVAGLVRQGRKPNV
jgi:membrane associated rhomboid family serine protease